MTEQPQTMFTLNDDEHFVKSLASDMSIFTQRDKIILKKKIYDVIYEHLRNGGSDSS